MSTVAGQLEKSKGLLNALDALSNRNAFVCLLVALVSAGILFALSSYLTTRLLVNGHSLMASLSGLVGGLSSLFIALVGASATGFILNAQTQQRPMPGIGNAFMTALVTLPRLIGVYLLLMLVLLGLALAVMLLILICKIPGIGALLYAFVFPIGVLVMGVALSSALYVTALTGPAVWNGNTLLQSVGLLIAIAQKRLLAVIVQTLLLGLLIGVVGGIVFGVLFAGISTTSILSIPVLGTDAGGMGGFGLGAFMSGSGAGSGHAMAAMFSGGILVAAVSVLPMLVAIAGYCQIFAAVAEGLDTQHIENKIRDAQDKARASMESARAQVVPQPAIAAMPAAAACCPACKQDVGADDLFCGNCGHKLG
jgi:hypothetical protein